MPKINKEKNKNKNFRLILSIHIYFIFLIWKLKKILEIAKKDALLNFKLVKLSMIIYYKNKLDIFKN